MILHLVRIALRNVSRHKLFTFINIFGLALSLSFCLLVIMIVADQSGFDTFHPRAQDVYRVLTDAHRKDGGIEPYASSPYPLGEVLASESPAVERVVHVVRGLSSEADLGGNRIAVNGFFTDKAFFDVFGFRLEKGVGSEALERPNGVIVTEETARKLFGERDPMGATIKLSGLGDFIVTGVLAPKPGKTHLEFDLLASLSSLPALERTGAETETISDWKNYYTNYTYIRLRPGHKPEELSPLLTSIQERFYGKLELESRDKAYSFELQPLLSITPGRMLSQSIGKGVPQLVLYFLDALALLGMAAAMFNYTNLTLARSLVRAKEIGLRKVAGAARWQLFAQLIGESVLMSLLAFVVAVVILQTLLIPAFQGLQLAKGSDITLELSPVLALRFVGFTFIVGLAAGFIPAGVMSGFRPAAILKDISGLRVFSGLTLRKILLVGQFTLSLVLLIVLTVIVRQIHHAVSMDYGMNWHNTVVVRLQGQDALRVAQQFGQYPNVERIAAISHEPLTWQDRASDVRVNRADNPLAVREYGVDANFLGLFGLRLVAGSNFHGDVPRSNENLILVNERFVQRFQLGTPQEAIGRTIIVGDSTRVSIAGVMKDFFFKPATYELEPLMIRYTPKDWNVLAVRLRGGDVRATSAYFGSAWKKLDPYHPFDGQLYKDIMTDVYDSYSDASVLVGFLALLAFTISLLGLLGIVTFQVESRIKEIGIRKVLGARIVNLMVLLARRELILLLISTLLAIPVGLLLSSVFLENFAQRISLGPATVLPGVLFVYLCAFVTIGVQALKAAFTNPVEALRYE